MNWPQPSKRKGKSIWMEEESHKFLMTLESKLLRMECLFWDRPDRTLALFLLRVISAASDS